MATYSANLALTLMATGEQSNTWGDTTNTNLGTLLEQAISGYVTQAITDGADTTITIPNGTTGVARNMFLELTGALTATRNLIVPTNKKLYFVHNNTTGGFAVTVKVSGLTGVSVPNGRKVILVSNGTDIVEAHNAISGNATVGGTLGVTGTSTLAALSATTGTFSSTLGVTGVATLGNGAILGTPASGVVTNLTGTASININGTVGATTATTGAFTTLSASGYATFTGSDAGGAEAVFRNTGGGGIRISDNNADAAARDFRIGNRVSAFGDMGIAVSTTKGGNTFTNIMTLAAGSVAVTGTLSATSTLSTTGGAAKAEAAASQAKSTVGAFNSGAAVTASAEILTFAQAGTQRISHFWAQNSLRYQIQTLTAGHTIALSPDTGNTDVLVASSTGVAVTGTLSATTTVAGSGGASTLSVPTRQVFLTGSAATYTTPANCRRIVVRMKGPGGSTHGSSTSADGGGAGAGTATSFNSITAAIGSNSGQASGGKPSGGSGGTGGTGTASLRIAGAMGHAQTTPYATGTNAYLIGGNGGGTGGGLSKDPTAYGTASGSAGVANSGGGASGAGLTTSIAFASASGGWVSGGGGEGEYAEITISSPAGTYTYTVGTAGAGGTAGTSGVVGAAGGSGFICVDEYY